MYWKCENLMHFEQTTQGPTFLPTDCNLLCEELVNWSSGIRSAGKIPELAADNRNSMRDGSPRRLD